MSKFEHLLLMMDAALKAAEMEGETGVDELTGLLRAFCKERVLLLEARLSKN